MFLSRGTKYVSCLYIRSCLKHIQFKIRKKKNIKYFFLIFFAEQAYTSPASLKCNGHFSCLTKCKSAYITGIDGCPQCDCVPGACLIMRTWNQKWTEHPCRCYVFISLVHCIPPLSNEPIFHISCPVQEHHLPIKSILTYMLYHLLSLCVAFCVSILRINNHIKPSV